MNLHLSPALFSVLLQWRNIQISRYCAVCEPTCLDQRGAQLPTSVIVMDVFMSAADFLMSHFTKRNLITT